MKLTSNQQAAQKRIAQKRKVEAKKAFQRALIFKKFSEPNEPRPAFTRVVDDSDEVSACIAGVREYGQYLDNIKWRKFEPITISQG